MMLSRVELIVLAALAAVLPARAGERDQLNACQALVERAAQAQGSALLRKPIANCSAAGRSSRNGRCAIREMSVDEQGRPLR